jgi:hypothetical protein
LALALAAGIRYGLDLLLGGVSGNRLRQVLPPLVVGVVALAQVGYYFGPHLEVFNVQVRDSKGYADGIDAALRAAQLPGNTQVYLVGKPIHDQNVPRAWLGFLSRDGDPTRYFPLLSVTPDTISHKFLLDLPHGVNYAFFVEPDEANALRLLMRYFPNAEPPRYSPWDIPAHKEYILIYVPGASMPNWTPLK